MRAYALALRLTQTISEAGLSESEQAEVTVSPVRVPCSAPTVTSATAPAHWRIACLKSFASMLTPEPPKMKRVRHGRAAPACGQAAFFAEPRCNSRGITSFLSSESEWCQASALCL